MSTREKQLLLTRDCQCSTPLHLLLENNDNNDKNNDTSYDVVTKAPGASVCLLLCCELLIPTAAAAAALVPGQWQACGRCVRVHVHAGAGQRWGAHIRTGVQSCSAGPLMLPKIAANRSSPSTHSEATECHTYIYACGAAVPM
jgi:hypothetical protein